MPSPTRTESVLVALVKDRADHAILHRELWYRIPVESAPKIVTERRVKIMGFYLPAEFGDDMNLLCQRVPASANCYNSERYMGTHIVNCTLVIVHCTLYIF